MKINKIAYTPVSLNAQQKKVTQNNHTNQTSPIEQRNVNMFAYQDYNISFGGRTPEDFYAQDFNRNNMPRTMKTFLDYDYEQRQHIPPEQMMHEVFKYIERAKDFDEVKRLYPNEELFKNLHPNKTASRKTVLSEIKIAREMGEAPLLKDGTDNFGMYVLKKIYSEGKTLKEISKDFLEKDINDEYKGLITKPIDYQTLSAYGIRFPNNGFWHSFISTREEYKKFFISLPKNMVDPNRIENSKTSSSHSSSGKVSNDEVEKENAPRPRKYRLPEYKKKQIKNDIKEAGGDIQILTKKIKKRFPKDDPQASFIIKYLSPIMTVAADKIHLSEEMKDFSENEKMYGKQSDEKHMFKRFWNANPFLEQDYSNSIGDSIELFEEAYGGGGNIPINNEFEPITKNSKNQHIIDFVSQDFLDLLDFSKDIVPKRNLKYQEHERLQQEWEQHFYDRYGDPQEEVINPENSIKDTAIETPHISTEEAINNAAKQNSCEVYDFIGKNGQDIKVTASFDELFNNRINEESKLYPSRYANAYKRYMLKAINFYSEDYKRAFITSNIRYMIDDSTLMSVEDFQYEDLERQMNFVFLNRSEEFAAEVAMAEIINKEAEGRVPQTYNFCVPEYYELETKNKNNIISETLLKRKDELNQLYDKYTTKPTQSEMNKIGLAIIEGLAKPKPAGYNSVVSQDTEALINVVKDSCKNSPEKRKFLRRVSGEISKRYPFMKCLLEKDLGENVNMARFEKSIQVVIEDLISTSDANTPIITYIVTPETLSRHMNEFTSEGFKALYTKINHINPKTRGVLNSYDIFNNYKDKDKD